MALTARQQAIGAAAGAAMMAFGAVGGALADDGKTIAEVANMPGSQSIQYIYDKAAERSLAIARKHGDKSSQCLRSQFVTIVENTDGSVTLPVGLEAARDTVLGFNAGGRGHYPADPIIQKVVDLRANKLCGVDAATISTAALTREN